MTCPTDKYNKLAQDCFGKLYYQLDLDDQIFIEDLYNEGNE